MTSLVKKAIEFLSKKKEGLVELSYQPRVLKETKDQEKICSLTRELINAQFQLCDDELTNRLWEEVANLNIDPERIINLMYKCDSNDDFAAMVDKDSKYLESSFEMK
ncbi:hypothetical protein [Prochlorococcus marinus]|uniref:hypothetical protein n=1 Tax=Prochlorococcus marinus TaxID=1219 RepID=UPI0022B4DF89|nr:hypothetical protein [Prochlorococcus marinus]